MFTTIQIIFILAHWIIYRFLWRKGKFGLFWIFLFSLGYAGLNMLDFTANPENEIVAFVYIAIILVMMITHFMSWKRDNYAAS